MRSIMLDERLSSAAKTISLDAIDEIGERYSQTGDPLRDAWAELYMPYHNQLHTINVVEDVMVLSGIMGFSKAEYAVATCAGAAHDIMHDLGMGSGENEFLSAQWLGDRMRRSGEFTKTMISVGEMAILGTATNLVHTGAHYTLHQAYKELQFPTLRAALVAEVVASADLGRLLQFDGPLLAHKMYKERVCGASAFDPVIDQQCIEFLELQTEITGSFSFDNALIDATLAKDRKAVHEYTVALLKLVKTGDIDSWGELMKRDIAFSNQSR